MNDTEFGELSESLRRFGASEATTAALRKMSDKVTKDKGDTLMEVLNEPGTNSFYATFWSVGPKKEGEGFVLDGLIVAYKTPLPIADRSFDGVHVKALERQLGEINWRELTANKELENRIGGPEKMDIHIGLLLMKIAVLNTHPDPDAREISRRLEYNFFAFTPMEAYALSDLSEFKKANIRSVAIDPEGPFAITVQQARNILDGRYVRPLLKDKISGHHNEKWLGVDFLARDEKGMSTMRYLDGSERFDLNKAMSDAKIQDPEAMARNYKVLQALSDGNPVILSIKKGDVLGNRVFYADPAKGRLSIDQQRTERAGLYKQDGIQRQSPGLENPDRGEGRGRRR